MKLLLKLNLGNNKKYSADVLEGAAVEEDKVAVEAEVVAVEVVAEMQILHNSNQITNGISSSSNRTQFDFKDFVESTEEIAELYRDNSNNNNEEMVDIVLTAVPKDIGLTDALSLVALSNNNEQILFNNNRSNISRKILICNIQNSHTKMKVWT